MAATSARLGPSDGTAAFARHLNNHGESAGIVGKAATNSRKYWCAGGGLVIVGVVASAAGGGVAGFAMALGLGLDPLLAAACYVIGGMASTLVFVALGTGALARAHR